MRVVIGNPPNIDAIDAVFHVKGKRGVIFTYGDTIYNPSGCEISSSLKAHESVHFQRQTNNTERIEAWWKQYLEDPEFRFNEELPAHIAEFKQFCAYFRDRNQQHQYLMSIAGRIAGPLYGNMADMNRARRLIAGGKA